VVDALREVRCVCCCRVARRTALWQSEAALGWETPFRNIVNNPKGHDQNLKMALLIASHDSPHAVLRRAFFVSVQSELEGVASSFGLLLGVYVFGGAGVDQRAISYAQSLASTCAAGEPGMVNIGSLVIPNLGPTSKV